MYLTTGEIISIILVTIAFTSFVVICGYTWQLHEARLLIDRQEDELYNWKATAAELNDEIYELKHWRAPDEGAGPDV